MGYYSNPITTVFFFLIFLFRSSWRSGQKKKEKKKKVKLHTLSFVHELVSNLQNARDLVRNLTPSSTSHTTVAFFGTHVLEGTRPLRAQVSKVFFFACQQNHTDPRLILRQPPPKTTIDFFQRMFHGCSTRGRALSKNSPPYVLRLAKGLLVLVLALSNKINTSGRVARGTAFQELRPGAGFTTGDFVRETLGGLLS